MTMSLFRGAKLGIQGAMPGDVVDVGRGGIGWYRLHVTMCMVGDIASPRSSLLASVLCESPDIGCP